ncbi:MAG: GNAT family N-acetyltransferase [Candidatus Bipolaricaulota bacterium]
MYNLHLPEGWMARPAQPADAERILGLFNARSRMMFGDEPTSRRDVDAWWQSPRFRVDENSLLILDEKRELAAVARVETGEGSKSAFGLTEAVHPKHQRSESLWDQLCAWGLQRLRGLATAASADGRVVARTTAPARDEARRAALTRAGFSIVATQNRMGVDLVVPPVARFPDGVRVRTAKPRRDLDALVDAYRDVWRDQPRHTRRPRAEVVDAYRRMIDEQGVQFDPSLWFVALQGKEVVGYCLCRAETSRDAVQGTVDDLGVRPAWRGRGVGAALVRHAFRELHARGCRRVELDMRSEQLTRDLRFYEAVGMRILRQVIEYEKELRPAAEPAPTRLAV